jgi:hypothetical protein
MKEDIADNFEITDLGEVRYLLKWDISRDRKLRKLQIGQQKYCEEVLRRFGMEDCNPVSTPMEPGSDISMKDCPTKEEDIQEMKKYPYREVLGSLMYLMVSTRPDLAHAVGMLGRYANNPGKRHWYAAKRVLRYLQGTKDYKLTFQGNQLDIHGYCDADFGRDLDERVSVSGVLIKAAGGAIVWYSNKQSAIAQFTAEAEYIAANQAGRDIVWVRQMCSEMGLLQQGPTVVYCDSQGALWYIKDPVTKPKAKHIDIKYHYVRKLVKEGVIVFKYVSTKDQVADGLTKPLPREAFISSRQAMGIQGST